MLQTSSSPIRKKFQVGGEGEEENRGRLEMIIGKLGVREKGERRRMASLAASSSTSSSSSSFSFSSSSFSSFSHRSSYRRGGEDSRAMRR